MIRLDFFPNLHGGTSAVAWDDPALDLAGGAMAGIALAAGLGGVLGAAPALVVPGAAILLALAIWLVFGRSKDLAFLCALALPLLAFAWTSACWGVLGYWLEIDSMDRAFGLFGYIFMGLLALLAIGGIAVATDNIAVFAGFCAVIVLMWFAALGVLSEKGTKDTAFFVFVVMRCVEIATVVAVIVGIVRAVRKASDDTHAFDTKAIGGIAAGLAVGLAVVVLFEMFGSVGSIGGEVVMGAVLVLVFIALGAGLDAASQAYGFDIDGIAILVPLLVGGSCYFLACGTVYVPLDAYDAASDLIASGGLLTAFVDGAMQAIGSLTIFLAQLFYWIADFVAQIVGLLFGQGAVELPFTAEDLIGALDATNEVNVAAFAGMVCGMVVLYLCMRFGSFAARKLGLAKASS